MVNNFQTDRKLYTDLTSISTRLRHNDGDDDRLIQIRDVDDDCDDCGGVDDAQCWCRQ